MPASKIQIEIMEKVDRIRMCGQGAIADFKKLCRKRGIDDDMLWVSRYVPEHMEVCKEVWDLWHTTKNFKVGDKVYIVPLTTTFFPNCVRATVMEVGDDGWGYRLRAFESDCPGIWMFDQWDKDLVPRTSKANRPVPKGLYVE